MVYYGVFLSAPTVGGSLYLNFFLASLVELPAIPIGIWIYNRLNTTEVCFCRIRHRGSVAEWLGR